MSEKQSPSRCFVVGAESPAEPRPSLEGRRVLVTGGAGFIGSHLVDELLAAGARRVTIVDDLFLGSLDNLRPALVDPRARFVRADASDLLAMDRLLAAEPCDVVFHLATRALLYGFENPRRAFQINVDLIRTLLFLQRRGAFQTLVHFSTSEVYGSQENGTLDESHPIRPTTPYAAGKAAADQMARSAVDRFGIDATIVRPFNTYGPRQNWNRGFEALIPRAASRIARGLPPSIQGDGAQTRDFLFVADTVRGALAAYARATRGEVIQLATGAATSVRDVVRGIARYFRYEGPFNGEPVRPGDHRRQCGDGSKARQRLGFSPQVDFENGLDLALDWYCRQPGFLPAGSPLATPDDHSGNACVSRIAR